MNQSEVIKLLHSTDWAKDRPEADIQTSMEHSCPYGLFLKTMEGKDCQIGFARVITDYTTTFYLMDVVIEEKYRHQGYGTLLMNQIMEDVGHLCGILHTETAEKFYEKYGFIRTGQTSDGREICMEKEKLVQLPEEKLKNMRKTK